jgi:cytoskeletal protein RodZ
MSLRTLLHSLQIEHGSKISYNFIILITISIFIFSMINYQSISAISADTKTPNDKTSNTKTPNDKTSNTKTPNDKTSNTKTPDLQDPTLSMPFTSHYADTLDKSNNPIDIPFP